MRNRVPKLPGGSLIYVKAGQDSTQVFDPYHPLYVRKLLGKYFVGDLQRNAEDLKEHYASIAYSDGDQEVFYLTLKQRVETYFSKHKINPRYHPHMFVTTAVIVGVYVLSYYDTFFGSHNIFLSMLLASIMGFCSAEVGMSITMVIMGPTQLYVPLATSWGPRLISSVPAEILRNVGAQKEIDYIQSFG